jgi:TolB-like protein/Tfp pilus assembly protein PilF
MGADEEAALRTLTANRQILDAAIAKHRGRIFHTAGDSVLAEFASPVDAVRCAVEAQRDLTAHNAPLPPDRRMAFRVGIHVGDVVVQGGNLLGDGVNIAARLESIAEPGGIQLSRAVYEAVRAALPLDYRHAGERRLKNIAVPVAVYTLGGVHGRRRARRWPLIAGAALVALAVGGAAVTFLWPSMSAVRQGAPTTASDKPSIAVLPFSNLGGDPQHEYFNDGMTEDLITDLSKVSGLLVIARNSSFVYKGRAVNVSEVGRELGVRYVLEGSVRRSGERIRINAQLIEVASGHHIWAERYDREFKDVFELQDDVRQKIVAALSVKLSPGESARLTRKPTQDVGAYDAWTRGLELLSRYTIDDNREARRMFLRAIEFDPFFARAYGQVANTYSLEIDRGWTATPDESAAQAVTYAQRAVALDDTLPEARWPLARAYAWQGQYERAAAEIAKAIALNPNYADGLAYQGLLLGAAGRAGEGMNAIQRAMRINPHYPFWYLSIAGGLLYQLERYEEAASTLRLGLERNPNSSVARRLLIATYGQLGQDADAQWEIAELESRGESISTSSSLLETRVADPIARAKLIDGLRKAGVKE